MAESEKVLKSLLKRVKESKKDDLKLTIKKKKKKERKKGHGQHLLDQKESKGIPPITN